MKRIPLVTCLNVLKLAHSLQLDDEMRLSPKPVFGGFGFRWLRLYCRVRGRLGLDKVLDALKISKNSGWDRF
jgi:hypothetical protein